MKRKEIEKIPYRTAKKNRKKFTHVAVAFTQSIKEIEHLFVEIYRNEKKSLGIPQLRIIFTKEDWGLYYAEPGDWYSGSFRDEYGRNVWEEPTKKRDQGTFMSEAEQDIIWNFCGESNLCFREYSSWTDRLYRQIGDIRILRREKRDHNRRKHLEERKENTPELPDDIEKWADQTMFRDSHFLYYKRKGRYVNIACSSCGSTATKATTRKNTSEGQFENNIETPRSGATGRCPICGAVGTWKPQGKTKGVYGLTRHCFIGQPYKETGAVIRYVQVEKIYRMEECAEEKETVLVGAEERYIITEIARRYIEIGKRAKTDYHKYSSWTGNFWDDCNLYGMSNIKIEPGFIYEKSYELLQGTILQYSGAQEFQKNFQQYNMMDYMERYAQYPQIEMFSKMGLYGVVEEMVKCRLGIVANADAVRPEDFLGIKKERLKMLIREKGDKDYLSVMQKEKRLQADWTEEDITLIKELELKYEELALALRYMSTKQLVNKIGKYAGCELTAPNELCCHAIGAVRTAAQLYMDYLGMREQRGYDLHNTVFLFPRDLQQAHDTMINEINKEEIDKRDMEVGVKYPNIQKDYRRLRKQYFYEDENYLIRPPRNAAEITREGRILHHCVGGDTYLQRHNDGYSTILFLRMQNMPDTPYITVELKDGKIVQWYGAYDRKIDADIINKWLKDYTKQLGAQGQIEVRKMVAIA